MFCVVLCCDVLSVTLRCVVFTKIFSHSLGKNINRGVLMKSYN